MPITLDDLLTDWQQNSYRYTDAYQSGRSSFVATLLPQTAVQFGVYQTLEMLHKRLGNDTIRRALNPSETIDSPVKGQPDGSWLKRSNMVGINVRTIGSFWNVVNYAPLTVGAALLLFGGWYLLSARKWFTGPVPDAGIDDELRWSVDRHRRSGG